MTIAQELLTLLPKFSGKRILVVGDICLDEYLIGKAQRLSREAPVPILEFQRRFVLPGAAANPALNLQALGAQTSLAGLVGVDQPGQTLRENLLERGINTSGVIATADRQTTVKTRVMAEVSLHFPQQLVRLDYQGRGPLDDPSRERLIATVASALDAVDAVLLSDYKGGVVDQKMVSSILGRSGPKRLLVTVDSQGELHKFRGVSIVKCNQGEAETALGCTLTEDKDFEAGAVRLMKQMDTEGVVITRGQEGLSMVDMAGQYLHIPATNKSEVFDVTGAGDTVIATLTLAMVAGATLAQAAHLANCAAGLVVRKLGNATVGPEELAQAISLYQDTAQE